MYIEYKNNACIFLLVDLSSLYFIRLPQYRCKCQSGDQLWIGATHWIVEDLQSNKELI